VALRLDRMFFERAEACDYLVAVPTRVACLEEVTLSATEGDKLFIGSIPAVYDRYLVPLIFEPYASDLAARVAAKHPRSVLEIAAGTGVATRALAAALPENVSVVATDLNQPMLDYAVSCGTVLPVHWQQADAMNLPFEDDMFDAVVCQFGVMFFPDRPKAYAEARRVLKRGGAFIFTAWDRIEENEFAFTVTAALQGLFPHDPPRFLARTPHGYHDVVTITRDLEAGGFGVAADVVGVTARSRAASPRDPAVAYCHGTPLRNEIEAHDATALGVATDIAAEAIAQQFGGGAVDGKIRANIITVKKSGAPRASRIQGEAATWKATERRSPSPGTAQAGSESPPEIYERYMVPAIFDAWVAPLLDLAAPQPGERLLDLACGTGVVARGAILRVGANGRVVGLDFNPAMLARARASQGAIEWREGNAVALPFADGEFDVVVCQQGLQFFPEAATAVQEVRRVLAPSGRFAAAAWAAIESSPGHDALARALEQHVGAEASRLMHAVFRFADAQTLETLLGGAGFHHICVRRERKDACFPSPELFARWVVAGSVLGRTGIHVPDENLRAIVRDVNEALQPYTSTYGLAFPMDAYLIVGQAAP
jgi:ubiquinone/menaquinone biosynthesis C-methylase UbiE